MGYRLSWTAIRGRSPEAVLKQLGMKRTGRADEYNETDLSGAVIASGWYVVVSNFSSDLYADLWSGMYCEMLSQKCELVFCYVNETSMRAHAMGWSDGHMKWSVVHDGDTTDRFHLESEGELPEEFHSIYKQLRSQQEVEESESVHANYGVDYMFDIPLEVARAVAGYRHDSVGQTVDGVQFEALTPTALRSFRMRLEKLFKPQVGR